MFDSLSFLFRGLHQHPYQTLRFQGRFPTTLFQKVFPDNFFMKPEEAPGQAIKTAPFLTVGGCFLTMP